MSSDSNNKAVTYAIEQLRDSPKRELYLDGSLLLNCDHIPPAVFELTELTALSISGSYGSARTSITAIPRDISRLSKLKILILNKNQLEVLPKEVFDLPDLEQLYLEQNDIAILPKEIRQLKKLRKLSLSNNRLTGLPPEVGDLTLLETLDLYGNQLKSLPLELGKLGQLTRLSVGQNPITNIPLEILKQPSAAILNYCRSVLEERVTRLYEAKLLIVGEGGVGKTCLMRRFVDNLFPANEATTEGIDIHQWQIETDSIKNFRVNVWDFGGQEIYHATHQFFLTKRSLYLFVWTARNDETNFDYWLNAIKLLSDSAPVIVVLSKIDERIRMIDERFIQSRFNNVIAFKRVSALTNVGMADLVDCIKRHIVELEHIGNVLPKVWIDIREHLESLDLNYIDYSAYKDICAKYELDAKQADFLSRYYHDLGVIRHFQDHPILRQIVFLRPEWATNAVYKLVDTKAIVKSCGRFEFDQLRTIWADYPEDKHLYLVALMKKFELCFQVDDTNTYAYIIPELLVPSPPDFDWTYEGNLGFEYRYNFMPAGIIPRFIVINHHLIEDNYYWKNGMILKREGNRGLIISDPFQRKIQIWICGSNKKELLSIVREKIDYIHKTLNEPNVKEMVKCICSECIDTRSPYFYDYGTLRSFYTKGRRTVACSHSAEDVSIELLLGGIGDVLVNTEAELLETLKAMTVRYDSEERVLEQANKIIQLHPNFMGIGINLNELIRKVFPKGNEKQSGEDETPSRKRLR